MLLCATLIWTCTAAQETPSPGISAERWLDQVREAATRGPDIDRTWRTYNALSHRLLEQHPALDEWATLLGVRTQFHDRDDFGWTLLVTALQQGWADEDILRILASWVRHGHLDPEALVVWREARRARPTWPRDDLEQWMEQLGLGLHPIRDLADSTDASAALPGSPPRSPTAGTERSDPPPPHPDSSPPETQRLAWSLDATTLRLLVTYAERFLRDAGEEPLGTPLKPLTPRQRFDIWTKARVPLDVVAWDDITPSPDVVAGIRRLFDALTTSLWGVDPLEGERLLAELPFDPSHVVALPAYATLEFAGMPFHRVASQTWQIDTGIRHRIVWLESRDDLEALLLDPDVSHLLIAGHASLSTYGFQGLTGPPERTLARLLRWVAMHAETLAPALDGWLRTGRTDALEALAPWIRASLGWTAESWSHKQFARLADTPGFQKKERLVLWACGVAEWDLRTGVPHETLAHRLIPQDMEAWLGARPVGASEGGQWVIHPLTPSSQPRFENELPDLLRTLEEATGQRLQLARRTDFLPLLTDDGRRFPGVAWFHDFLAAPHGHRWFHEDVAESGRD